MKFKCRLKIIFAERNIRQNKFAEKVGISQTTLSSLINNNSLPRFDVAFRIARELDLKIEDIWEEVDKCG